MVKLNRRNTCKSSKGRKGINAKKNYRKTRATTRRARGTRRTHKNQKGGGPFSYRIPDAAVGDYHWIDDDSDAPRLMSLGELRKIKAEADSA